MQELCAPRGEAFGLISFKALYEVRVLHLVGIAREDTLCVLYQDDLLCAEAPPEEDGRRITSTATHRGDLATHASPHESTDDQDLSIVHEGQDQGPHELSALLYQRVGVEMSFVRDYGPELGVWVDDHRLHASPLQGGRETARARSLPERKEVIEFRWRHRRVRMLGELE